MLKFSVSVLSMLLCSVGINAQELKYGITEYELSLVKYLIKRRILVVSSDEKKIQLNQKKDVYLEIMSKIEKMDSINAVNCGGNGGNGL